MFIGRSKELQLLKSKYSSDRFEFGIIHGRRRVGKTTLLKESIKDKNAIYFLAQQANMKTNLEIFSKTYGQYKGIGDIIYNSFEDLLTFLFHEEDLIIIIDEFTYLLNVDSSFESVLQGVIDNYSQNSSVKLIISGSEIGMYENIFSYNRPLFGRQTFSCKLNECDYLESSLYINNYSHIDKIKAYAIFGGLPYYLSQINDMKSLKDNICKLVIDENSRFAYEPQMILRTELRNIQEYQSVLQAIHSGSTKLSIIDSKSKINNTSKTIKYVNKLIDLEIIKKETKFLETPNSKKHLYKISNNFIAFFYKFIWRNQASRTIMKPGDFYDEFIETKIDQYVSERFEEVCKQFLIRNYKKRNNEIIKNIDRFWFNDRKLEQDIEIDVCVQTRNNIHIYECKWTESVVKQKTLNDLIDKGKYLNATKFGAFSKTGFSNELSRDKYDLITIKDMFEQ